MTPTLITLDGNDLDEGDRYVLSRWSQQAVSVQGDVQLVLNDFQRRGLAELLQVLNKGN